MPILEGLKSLHRDETERGALQPAALEGFKRSQQMAYACVTEVARRLEPGMTERDAAAEMDAYLKRQGVKEYFHQPFAWFGDRTLLRFRVPLEFFPTWRKLQPGMAVILDVAPIVDGFTSDIGYACKVGHNAEHDQMLLDLEPYRQRILDGVRAKKNLDAIYREVDELIHDQSYGNCHKRYPFRVLAHRVSYVPDAARSRLKVAGFGPPALGYLFGRLARKVRSAQHESPFWNDLPSSAHPAEPGLWAVEPHIGRGDLGVKWEELMVVTDDDAYWLDDDLPHVRRFAELKRSAAE